MITDLEKARQAFTNFITRWEQGLKDGGLWEECKQVDAALNTLEQKVLQEG